VTKTVAEDVRRVSYVRVVSLIPVCVEHGRRMRQYSHARKTVKYYRCPICGKTASGTMRSEQLPAV